MTTTAIDANSALYDSYSVAARTASTDSTTTADSQNRFLTLLVTQLKNQDPLSPMDSAQMTSQLAQISTVDGIEKLNRTLEALESSTRNSQTVQAAALMGRGVLVPGGSIGLSDGMSVAGVELALPADSVTISITDSAGLLVRTIELGSQDAGAHGFAWDGLTDTGVAAADGEYRFSVEAKLGTDIVNTTPLQFGVVSGVITGSEGAQLSLGALGSFALTQIRQIL